MTAAKTKSEQPDKDEKEMTMEMATVTMEEQFLQYIPGPQKDRLKVLRAWAQDNCTDRYSVDSTGVVWTFMEPKDAEAFEAAWNRRTSQ